MRCSIPVRVLVAVKEEHVRAQIRCAFTELHHLPVGGELVNGLGLLNAIRIERPDLLVMHDEFLDLDDALLIVQRSYYTRLPPILFMYSANPPGWMKETSLPITGMSWCGIAGGIHRQTELVMGNADDEIMNLRIWAALLTFRAKLLEGQSLFVTRRMGKLGLLHSCEILFMATAESKLKFVTKSSKHEAVDTVQTILSQVESNCYFEADQGTWIHLDRMGSLRKLFHPPADSFPIRSAAQRG